MSLADQNRSRAYAMSRHTDGFVELGGACMVTKKLSATLAASIVGVALTLGACDGAEQPPNASSIDAVCLDLDGDGYGAGCEPGGDCDDRDPSAHADCAPCRNGGPGCACDVEGAIAVCSLPDVVSAVGERVCTRGTLTCRDGRYSACENQTTQTMSAQALLSYRALIDRDAAPTACDPCDPDCFRVEDPLDAAPPDGVNLAVVDAGGMTIAFEGDGGAAEVVTPPPLDAVPCTPGAPPDTDCDGIPDGFDAYPAIPNQSSHNTIFMGLPPGTAAAQRLNLNFRLNSADIYFYLDMSTDVYDPSDLPDPADVLPDPDGDLEYSGSGTDLDPVRPMGALKNAIAAAMNTGSFLPDPSIDCGDRDGDGAADNNLKSAGIAGNLACLIPDIAFGAGWFRDVPFTGPLSNGRYVAAARTFMFGHAFDVAQNSSGLQDALERFTTSENIVSPTDLYYGNLPEGSMQGLWSLATGGEIYTGWSRAGIPARRGCAAGTWGYPCFREASLPIVLHVTDAAMQNGPRMSAGDGLYTGRGCLEAYTSATCNPLDYDGDVLVSTDPAQAVQATPNGTYLPLSTAGESFTTAQPVGELVSQLVTYVGSTARMAANVTRSSIVACSSSSAWNNLDQASPDVVFRFSVQNADNRPGFRTPLVISARGSEFDATLMVLPADAGFAPTGPGPCSDDTYVEGSWIPELNTTLPNGNYVAILKGYYAADAGRFQLTLGNPALATPARFAPHPWSGGGGVSEALRDHDMRVVGLCATPSGNCPADNPYTFEQSSLLARSTSALAADGSPLAFSINPYSSVNAVGTAIVAALAGLATERTMDVTLRLIQAPDDPSPDFRLTVEAIDTPGDACDPPVDTNSDGVADLHPACRPGARPNFRVTFSNPPVPDQVPRNPAANRPGGGYEMRLELVGDGNLVLDQIPVYLVPNAVAATTPPNAYAAQAVYEQTVFSNGCISNEAPRWRVLGWDATVPSGTELSWDVCLAESEADLATCSYVRVGSVLSGGPCTLDAQCENGYCDASNVCHFVTGPSCAVDTDCGTTGRCVTQTVGRACMWTGNPVDLAPALLPSTQGLALMRVRMTMQSNSARSLAPTVNRFRVEYTCAPVR